MSAFLWALQVLLGVAFVAAGLMHAGLPGNACSSDFRGSRTSPSRR